MKALKHFGTITKHKILVMKECLRVWDSAGRDCSMTCPSTAGQNSGWGADIIRATGAPNNAEREDKGFSSAWLHHKGRNKHHYEYWIDYGLDGSPELTGMKMPVRYVVEMFLDRIAASKVYKGDLYKDSNPLEYYLNGKAGDLMHPESRELLEKLLRMLAEQGEEKTYRYIRREVLKKRR